MHDIPGRADHGLDCSKISEFGGNPGLFGNLDESELEEVHTLCEEKEFGPKELIYNEGSTGDSIYVVLKGMVKLTKSLRGEDRKNLKIIRTGEFFGEMSFIDRHVHCASAESLVETCLLRIRRMGFNTLAEKNPLLGYKLILKIAGQDSNLLRETNDRFLEMMNYIWWHSKT